MRTRLDRERQFVFRVFKVVLLLTIMMCIIAIPRRIYAASAREKAVKLYKSYLSKFTANTWEERFASYMGEGGQISEWALIYLDHNRVPELVLKNTQGDWAILMIINGRVKYVDGAAVVEPLFGYYEKKGVIRKGLVDMDVATGLTLHKISKGKVSGLYKSVPRSESYKSLPYFQNRTPYSYAKNVNGKANNISKAKYTVLLKRWIGKKKMKKISWRPYNRETLIKYFK